MLNNITPLFHRNCYPRFLFLFMFAFTLLMVSRIAMGALYFDPALLETGNSDNQPVDLSHFEQGGQQPGVYRVEIVLNKHPIDVRELSFFLKSTADGKQQLHPCLGVSDLLRYGVKAELLDPTAKQGARCDALSAVPQASARFLFGRQQLLLSIPQAALARQARGYVAPQLREAGIPALLLNYRFSGANSHYSGKGGSRSSRYYLSLRPGVNLGAWRLRHHSNWLYQHSHHRLPAQQQWQVISTYLQRDIGQWDSRLTLGDYYSHSGFFESMPFRGVQLATETSMQPGSVTGYAPLIRGIARSNAQVTVRQQGYTLYQDEMAPGAFEINDIAATGGSGDLQVTIREADGSEHQLIVPYASLPVLVREGRFHYSLTAGQYRSDHHEDKSTPFGEATAVYGLPAGWTVYSGGQLTAAYHALMLGAGKNMGSAGALSAEVFHSVSALKQRQQEKGQLWRMHYSKSFVSRGSHLSVSAYRSSRRPYRTLSEAQQTCRSPAASVCSGRLKQRADISLSQSLWQGAGSLSLTLVNEDYWHHRQRMQSVSAGYNNSWHDISYGINYSFQHYVHSDSDQPDKRNQIVSLHFSLPLGKWLPHSYAAWNLNHIKNGEATHSLSLSGSASEDHSVNWFVQQSDNWRNTAPSSYLSIDWHTPWAQFEAAYGWDKQQRNIHYGLAGGMVLHADGITLSRALGQTIVLVKAPGASGVGISNQSGVKTDWRGYAILPAVSAYNWNTISLDTATLPEDTELPLTSKKVVPGYGAVVKADFDTSIGHRILMTLQQQKGNYVPFGATASSTTRPEQAFLVGDNGQVYLTGMADNETLKVQWGKKQGEQCEVKIRISAQRPQSGLYQLTGQCQQFPYLTRR